MDQQFLEQLVHREVENAGAFVVDFKVSANNKIHLLVEHPKGATLERLTAISRAVEAGLDRDQEDFEIEVSSPGVGAPLMVDKQYHLNIGRDVSIKTVEGEKQKGKLINYDGSKLTLEWKERVPKEKGKGKKTVTRQQSWNMDSVEETKVEIRF